MTGRKRLAIAAFGLLVILLGAFATVKFAQGYRPNFQTRRILGTGLLVANSFPDGAQVFINDRLTTATNDTLNVSPDTYTVEIKKDGFTSWKKTLVVRAELVTQTNATLFPTVPTLKPLTLTGTFNPTPSPDGQKITYLVTEAANPSQNGIWVFELANQLLVRTPQPRQILRQSFSTDSLPRLTWSPDARDVLVSTDATAFLLDTSRLNDASSLTDVTARLSVIFTDWETQLKSKELGLFLTLPKEIQTTLLEHASNMYFSPDDEKVLYTATTAVSIPANLIPDLPSESTQPEERELEAGATYVYDIKEDRNFRVLDPRPAELGELETHKVILVDQAELAQAPGLLNLGSPASPVGGEATPSAQRKLQGPTLAATMTNFTLQYSPLTLQSLQWFPTSNHLILSQDDRVIIMEYDGGNPAVVYANTFEGNFAFPWPNGSQLVILTNFNQSSTLPPNLYSINLK